MADFTEPILVERLQTEPLSSSLTDSSSCDPGGSAAGSLMDSAWRCSYGLPGASWALASVDGALLQQAVALRPRRGLESYQTSRGCQAWGEHHLPDQASLCKSILWSWNSCLCRSFLCSDACPLPLLPLSLLRCCSGRLARDKFCVWRRLHRSSVHWGSHSSRGSTGKCRGCRCPMCCPGVKPYLIKKS